MATFGDVLEMLGYVPEDDSWNDDGRRTYINSDDATRAFLKVLKGALARKGWYPDETKLRTFRHFGTTEIIEIEPGGADVTGHYLHHMKTETVA